MPSWNLLFFPSGYFKNLLFLKIRLRWEVGVRLEGERWVRFLHWDYKPNTLEWLLPMGKKHSKHFLLVPNALEIVIVIFKTLKNVNQFKMTTLFSVLRK